MSRLVVVIIYKKKYCLKICNFVVAEKSTEDLNTEKEGVYRQFKSYQKVMNKKAVVIHCPKASSFPADLRLYQPFRKSDSAYCHSINRSDAASSVSMTLNEVHSTVDCLWIWGAPMRWAACLGS